MFAKVIWNEVFFPFSVVDDNKYLKIIFNTDGTVNDSQLAIKYPVKRIDFLDSNIRKNIINVPI